MKKKIDLTGQVFGKLTVIDENFDKKKRHWNCICECGVERVIAQRSLNPNGTKSCPKCAAIKPRVYDKPEYTAWLSMKSRCFNSNHVSYKNYGGRGITVCPEWKHDFKAFYNHIGPHPFKGAYLDRIDPNKNYEPGNVRWVTAQMSSINTRVNSTNTSGVTGVSYYKSRNRPSKWSAEIIRNGKKHKLGFYKTKEEAIAARLAKQKELDAALI